MGGRRKPGTNDQQKMPLEGLVKCLILSHVHCPVPTHQQCSLKQGSLYHKERKSAFLAVVVYRNSPKKICQSPRIGKSQGLPSVSSPKTCIHQSMPKALATYYLPLPLHGSVGDLMKPFFALPTSWQQEVWASAGLRQHPYSWSLSACLALLARAEL